MHAIVHRDMVRGICGVWCGHGVCGGNGRRLRWGWDGDGVRLVVLEMVVFGVGVDMRGLGERYEGAFEGDGFFSKPMVLLFPFFAETFTFGSTFGAACDLFGGWA